MKPNNLLITVACCTSIILQGCGTIKTNQVTTSEASVVPADRVFSLQVQTEGTVPISVIRDTGHLGGGCYLAIEAYGKLVARLDTGETVRFFLVPGEHELTVASDPMGRGLCAVGFTSVTEKHQIQKEGKNLFRLSSRMYRRPELEPIE